MYHRIPHALPQDSIIVIAISLIQNKINLKFVVNVIVEYVEVRY